MQKDHVSVCHSQGNVQVGQDQVKLSLIDAKPDHNVKVPETSQKGLLPEAQLSAAKVSRRCQNPQRGRCTPTRKGWNRSNGDASQHWTCRAQDKAAAAQKKITNGSGARGCWRRYPLRSWGSLSHNLGIYIYTTSIIIHAPKWQAISRINNFYTLCPVVLPRLSVLPRPAIGEATMRLPPTRLLLAELK